MILGAGYAGLSALHGLKHHNLDITLVDRHPYHTLVTELHEAAAHNRNVKLNLEPMLSGVELFPGKVHSVDLDKQMVETNNGLLDYDYMILALGSNTNFFRITGLAQHALELKSTEDANVIFERFTAMQHSSQPEQQLVIGGAGLTGVELATELARRASDKIQIHLVEAGRHILPLLEPKLREHAQQNLIARGVKLHLGQRIIKAEVSSVMLEDGTVLPSAMTIWTGGVQAADVVQGQHLERGIGNRLVVDSHLALKNYPNVFVAGDMALALDQSGKPVPTTAQHAAQQGNLAAQNLLAATQERSPRAYKPSTLGELVSLGGWLGVGWLSLPLGQRLRLIGVFASLVKRASVWKHVLSAKGF